MVGLLWFEEVKEWFSDAYWHWRNVFYFRVSEYNDDIDRCAFFEELNYGWYQMYIYPYDDEYYPSISRERESILGGFPQQYTFYVSEVEYDRLMSKIDNSNPPSDTLEKLYEIKISRDT